ncbi:unnamed protein product [Paramecium pentaurelia]|uniref:Uncharacterized protein n=1 Tax=Paramecium pentaurelia TaxID=43138 RepID=A0A8S1S4V7_9CILI|nr:unnamed protein product [Paramecium pentaurelia]
MIVLMRQSHISNQHRWLQNFIYQYFLDKLSRKQSNIKYAIEASKFYPSVDCGVINNKKFKELGIHFTSLITALEKKIDFFVKETSNLRSRKQGTLEKLIRKLTA